MVHKNKTRLETDHTGVQSSSRGLQNMSSGTSSAYTTRPFRQFSTKSKARNAAGFKGLHKGITHDGSNDADIHHLGESSFRKSRSSDSLYRKRVISGLNMTALTRVKSNPGQPTCSRSRSSSVNSSTTNTFEATSGLKPSTSKPTHSVLELRGGDEEMDDDTSTDEEVEYFSDEEENENENHNVNKIQKPSSTVEDACNENVTNKSGRTPEETKMLSKSFSQLTMPYRKASESEAPPLLNQPSYKAPSSLIHPQREKESDDSNNESSGNGDNSDKYENRMMDMAPRDQAEKLKKRKPDVIGDDNILHDEGDDHIDNNHLYNVDATTSMEASAHSLKRQGKNLQKTDKSELPIKETGQSLNGHGNYIVPQRDEDHERYVPSMILSQSMGVERRFDQPASIQNSLADNYRETSRQEEAQNDCNATLNKENQIINSTAFEDTDKDVLHEKQRRQWKQKQEDGERQNLRQQQHHEQEQQHEKTLQPQSHLRQQGQLAPKEHQLQQRQEHIGNVKHNIQSNFPTSVSSLANSLQKMAPENVYSASRKSPFLPKKPSQLSFLGANLRSPKNDNQGSYLRHETSSNSSDINNFAQFLKSDNIDGESRTQRKLWLQRENSILDLNTQHDSCDSIFLAGDIGVKREFERISHEYTNVRRFSNPIEEALTRVTYEQENVGLKNVDSDESEAVDSLIPKLFNGSKEIEEILPKSESVKLYKVLQSIWKEESSLFNRDANPVSRKSPTSSHPITNVNRSALKNTVASSSVIQHQRMINSLQPTTRAVNRRLENALHHHQRQ